MVHGFVKQSGGHIKIHSKIGKGTTVRIYLPRSRDPDDVLVETKPSAVKGGTEQVLVVEDDDEVRATAGDMLTELGYNVLKAKDPDSALAIIDSGIVVDLMFTDVVMPGKLQSTELARRARQRLPHLAVLFTSGYPDAAIVHRNMLDTDATILNKPYSREELAAKIRQVLQKPQQFIATQKT